MKFFKLIFLILVIFSKTGNVLSSESIFNVNNIEVVKKTNASNKELTNQAILKGFNNLKKKLLLEEDINKLSSLNISEINDLVSYYQILRLDNQENKKNTLKFNIFFDKEKMHKLFYSKNISYSEISKREFYFLPLLKTNDELFIFNQNFFYEKWNEITDNELIEMILPIENIELVQYINSNKNNLFDLDLRNIFQEYTNKNLALVFIDETDSNEGKIYIRTKILSKNIDKNLIIKKIPDKNIYYEEIIKSVNNEIIDIIKSQNLVDVRTPSFLNVKLFTDKKNNLAELNRRFKNVGLIEKFFVQELNHDYILLKIKYLGKLEKIINQLQDQKIILRLINEQWSIKIL